ncbi:MAG: bacillithiol biosynthesis cysteine-adding enzyme BshC [Deltaproteobacteria bacterium]|nr:bacillithiol biosynthesis cysteine-adding enzyme BshC [Deltaproteobacteria bacterium]
MMTTVRDEHPKSLSKIFEPLAIDSLDNNGLALAAKQAASKCTHPSLIEVIIRQNADLKPSTLRHANIAKLGTPKTIAVIAGQQAGLFLGPLYTFYKACSCIALAKHLELISGIPTVPIFWIQDEDHDFAEINHCWIPNMNGDAVRLELLGDKKSDYLSRVSVKYRTINSDIEPLLDIVKTEYQALPFTTEIIEQIEACYKSGKSISDAFREFLGLVFADDGLVLFSPRDAAVSNLLSPIFELSLEKHAQIAQALIEQTAKLTKYCVDNVVHIRENSPLFFFHKGGADGPRYRLSEDLHSWNLIGGNCSISNSELIAFLKKEPLRFSTSALLRPIAQDYLFPTVAQIAGPSEINYLAQMRPLYDIFALNKPLIVPRPSILCLEPKIRRKLSQLGLTASDLALSETDLLKKVAQTHSSPAQEPAHLENQILAQIEKALEFYKMAASSVDETLLGALARTSQKIANQVHVLVQRYEEAFLRLDDMHKSRLKQIRNALMPNDMHQERVFSPLYFLCKYGYSFKNRLIETINPLSRQNYELDL